MAPVPGPAAAPVDAEAILVGFVRALRRSGITVPPSATINYANAIGHIDLDNRDQVYWAGRSTLIRRPEDIELHDRVFAAYWEQSFNPSMVIDRSAPPITLALDSDDDPDDDQSSSDDEQDPDDGDIQQVRFSRAEVLVNKDFAQCSDDELAELTAMMSRLRFTTHTRRSRRQIPSGNRGAQLDVGRTMRKALRHQGETFNRSWTSPATKPRRLVLVLDVSGSMEPYARALIRFAHAAVTARSRVEVFSLGTRLTRLTRHLQSRDPDRAIATAMPEVKDWAGGTRLGDGITLFNNTWAIRGMARGAIVVVLSDGWDRGDPEELGAQMRRLHRVTKQLIWVNPLKATPGYAPLAAGMAAALPYVDRFIDGHSYASLEHLATIIAGYDVPARAGSSQGEDR